MYHIRADGEEITFDIFPEHHIVANFDFIGAQLPSNYFYETLEDSSVLSLDHQMLDGIISKSPKLEANRKFFLRSILLKTKKRIESFVLMKPEERYQKFVEEYPDLSNRVPDKYIAQVIGVTPVSLSRIRKRLVIKK